MKRALLWGVGFVVLVALWTWYDLHNKPANERIQEGLRKIINNEPSLKPMYEKAISDGVLTTLEAGEIVEKANELKGS